MVAAPAEYRSPVIDQPSIARVCDATNDPSPVHLDARYATEVAGYPGVLVPGTMLLGWVGEYLETWAGGPENLRWWSARFLAPVWAGDSLHVVALGEAEPVGGPGGGYRCAAEVSNDEGRIVGKVEAVLVLAPGG